MPGVLDNSAAKAPSQKRSPARDEMRLLLKNIIITIINGIN